MEKIFDKTRHANPCPMPQSGGYRLSIQVAPEHMFRVGKRVLDIEGDSFAWEMKGQPTCDVFIALMCLAREHSDIEVIDTLDNCDTEKRWRATIRVQVLENRFGGISYRFVVTPVHAASAAK